MWKGNFEKFINPLISMPKSIHCCCLQSTHVIAVFTAIVLLTTSCSNTRNLVILNDVPDSARIALPYLEAPISTIQVDDILEIKISGSNPETTNDFNTKGAGFAPMGSGGVTATSSPNYLVDREGNIEIYKIGKIKATGLTLEQFKNNLVTLLEKELVAPSVVVRFTNLRFTVLGEVRTPSVYSTPNEKISILEALGYAGDLTIYAKRNAVRIIRDSSGHREIGNINLNQKSLFTSPFYYIKRNDVILVESDFSTKKQSENIARTASLIGILSSLITVIYLVLRK